MRTKFDVYRGSYLKINLPPCDQRFCLYSFGIIFNLRAVWVGLHSSFSNKRICINLLPCLTFWLTLPGGEEP